MNAKKLKALLTKVPNNAVVLIEVESGCWLDDTSVGVGSKDSLGRPFILFYCISPRKKKDIRKRTGQ